MRYDAPMTGTSASAMSTPSRRERARAATLTEIKQTALDLMREQGTTDVRFTDIARVMGLTPPALYRYYADRDELLTDMITDAYHDLAAALAVAVEAQEPTDPQAHLLLVAQAYRRWALEDPQRFALIFGLPVPGYAAPEDGPTVEAAQRAMANLAAVVHRAGWRGPAPGYPPGDDARLGVSARLRLPGGLRPPRLVLRARPRGPVRRTGRAGMSGDRVGRRGIRHRPLHRLGAFRPVTTD